LPSSSSPSISSCTSPPRPTPSHTPHTASITTSSVPPPPLELLPCHRSPSSTTRRSTCCCQCTYTRHHQRLLQHCPNIHCRHSFCISCRTEWEFFVFVCSCCDWPLLAERMREKCDACGAITGSWIGRAEWLSEEGIREMRADVLSRMPW
jgi:hypothetical protein